MAQIQIPELGIELLQGGEVARLEQGGAFGEAVSVDVHRIHLMELAAMMGLVRGSPDLARRVHTLERRMLYLRKRIDWLDDLLLRAAEKGHEDLSEECTWSAATLDVVDEFLEDLGIEETQPEPTANPAETQRISASPADGGPVQGTLPMEGAE